MKYLIFWILLPILTCLSEAGTGDPLSIDVLCDSTTMYVHVRFGTPFEGMIYSKGYLNDDRCRYLPPQGKASDFTFQIPQSRCGTETSSVGSAANTVVFQSNPVLETSMDRVRKISCDSRVTRTTPETTVFNSDSSENSPKTWMEIKRLPDSLLGKKPGTNIRVGDEMIVVIYISKPQDNYSVKIVNCEAHDDQTKENATIVKLLDSTGCPLEPQIFGSFEFLQKNSGEFIVAISHMTAFKFRGKEKLFITCGIDACSDHCSTICLNSSTYEHHSNLSKNELSKRTGRILGTSSTNTTLHKPGKQNLFNESTARRLMKTMAFLSSKLKPMRENRRLEMENSIKKRYGEPEHTTQKLYSTATRLPQLQSDVHPSGITAEDTRSGSFLFRRIGSGSLNGSVTQELTILPADVVMNVNNPNLNEYKPYCISLVKLSVITSCLLLLVLCLLVACILLTLNIRAINRKNSISRFLLYSYE